LLGDGEVLEGSEEVEVWRAVKEFEWVRPGSPLWKVPLTPKQIPELEALLEKSDCRRRYSVAGNLCWLASNGDPIARVEEILVSLQLEAVSLFGEGLPKVLGHKEASPFAVRVKQALDPHGRFLEI
jgi:hypothetical protein